MKIIARANWTYPWPCSFIFWGWKVKLDKGFLRATDRKQNVAERLKSRWKTTSNLFTKIINTKMINKSNAAVISGHHRQTWEIKGLSKAVPASPGVATAATIPGRSLGMQSPSWGSRNCRVQSPPPLPSCSPLFSSQAESHQGFSSAPRVRQTWEARQELLRDPGRHKRLLPQRALSSGPCVH